MIFKKQKQYLIFIPPIVLVVALFSVYLCYLPNYFLFKIIFFIVASVSIYIYGRYAFEIHNIIPKKTKIIDIIKEGTQLKEEVKIDNWYIYNQYWLNGLGAFIGWLALYILLFYKIRIDSSSFNLLHFIEHLSWSDFVLILVAFFGITGYFPYAVLIGKFPGK